MSWRAIYERMFERGPEAFSRPERETIREALREAFEAGAASPTSSRADALPKNVEDAIHAFADAHRAAAVVPDDASICEHRAAMVVCDEAYCALSAALRALGAAPAREPSCDDCGLTRVPFWLGKRGERTCLDCTKKRDAASPDAPPSPEDR